MTTRHSRVLEFLAWAGVATLVVVGFVSILSVGLLLLAVGCVAGALVLRWRNGLARAAFGVLAGAGVPFLYVAWTNRSGPGSVCTHDRRGSSCTQELSPWPWLAIGLLLIASSVVAYHCTRKSSAQAGVAK